MKLKKEEERLIEEQLMNSVLNVKQSYWLKLNTTQIHKQLLVELGLLATSVLHVPRSRIFL